MMIHYGLKHSYLCSIETQIQFKHRLCFYCVVNGGLVFDKRIIIHKKPFDLLSTEHITQVSSHYT